MAGMTEKEFFQVMDGDANTIQETAQELARQANEFQSNIKNGIVDIMLIKRIHIMAKRVVNYIDHAGSIANQYRVDGEG